MKQIDTPKLWLAFVVVIFVATLSSCGLNSPQVKVAMPLSQFQYAYIAPTGGVHSSSSVAIGGYTLPYSNSVNPRDLIAGHLSKRGFVIVPEVSPRYAKETLIVNYGESNKRELLVGYALEVTIQFITADTNKLVAVATAEGLGSTEADDIREAIARAISALFDTPKTDNNPIVSLEGTYY